MGDAVSYRFMRSGEEAAVCDLVFRVFNEYVAPDYTSEGVREFRRYVRPDQFLRRSWADHFTLVAVEGDEIVGMIELRNYDHVSLFYVDQAHLGAGIGKGLLHNALEICQRHKPEVSEVSTHSSLYAAPIYEKLGFRSTSPEQVKDGMRFVPMVLDLGTQDA